MWLQMSVSGQSHEACRGLRLLSLLEFSRWLPERLLAVSLESPEPAGQVTVLQEAYR